MAFDISDIVNVTVQQRPSTTLPTSFGRTLIFTATVDSFGTTGANRDKRVLEINSLGDLGTSSTNQQLRDTVSAYFAQSPNPPPIKVGRFFHDGVQGSITGQPVQVSGIAGNTLNLTFPNSVNVAITNPAGGSITGQAVTVASIVPSSGSNTHTFTIGTQNISWVVPSSTTATGIAAALQVQLRAQGFPNAGVTGSLTNSNANIAFSVTNLPILHSFAPGGTHGSRIFGSSPTLAPTGGDLEARIQATFRSAGFADAEVNVVTTGTRSGTDLNNSTIAIDITALGTSKISPIQGNGVSSIFGSGFQFRDGFSGDDRGNVGSALNKVIDQDNDWYFVIEDNSFSNADKVKIATWAAATKDKHAIINVITGTINDFTSGGNTAKQIVDQDNGRVTAIWTDKQDYKSARLAAQFSAIDLSGVGVLRTAKFLTLSGAETDTFSRTDQQTLNEVRANYYTNFGATPVFAEGVTTKDGTWIDQQYWLDWFVNTMQNQIFSVIRQSVPQTIEGVSGLKAAMEAVCAVGVVNGGIAPGRVSETTAGDIRRFTGGAFEGYLTTGYLVAIQTIDIQTPAERAARKAPDSRVYLKGAGAFHSADIIVDFTQ